MNCNTAGLTYNISSSAVLYSTAAGLLAGFAFTALIYIIPGGGNDAQARATKGHVLLTLVFAFIDLVLVSLLFSFLAGEQGCGLSLGRAASEEMLGEIAFSFALLTLLHALVIMIDHLALGELAGHVRFLVTVLGPPMALFLIFFGAQHISLTPWVPGSNPGDLYLPQHGRFVQAMKLGSKLVPIAVGLVCLCLWLSGGRRARANRSPAAPGSIGGASHPLTWYPYLGLGMVLATVFRSAALPVIDPSAKLSSPEVWSWIVASSLLLLAQAVILAFVRPVQAPPASRDSDG